MVDLQSSDSGLPGNRSVSFKSNRRARSSFGEVWHSGSVHRPQLGRFGRDAGPVDGFAAIGVAATVDVEAESAGVGELELTADGVRGPFLVRPAVTAPHRGLYPLSTSHVVQAVRAEVYGKVVRGAANVIEAPL